MKKIVLIAGVAVLSNLAFADNVKHVLSGGDFSQDWSNAGLITVSDNWSGVPSIEGYRGDDAAGGTPYDPSLVTGDLTVLDVNANNTNPNTFTTGGVTEFDTIANPTVALQGSGTADAPGLVFYMDSTGRSNVTFAFNARDIDGSTDNSIQKISVQWRVGGSGPWAEITNIADASTGPSLADQVTPVSVTSALWDNQGTLEFRVLTGNAVGNDEWIGIDDIRVTSSAVPEPASMLALGAGLAAVAARRRRK